MAAGSTALVGQRPTQRGGVRHTALSAVLVAIALTVVTSMVGRELVSIQSLAQDVQSHVLPRIMARQQRAIWTESLRSAADVVVYAPDPTTRHQALAKAEQLAANVTHADIASRAALDDAWASIRLAASRADEAERINTQMRAMLSEADSLITDMSANLSSIVEDSGATLERLIKEAVDAHQSSGLSRQVLEEVLAVNTTSHDLLASLDSGRIIVTSALSMATDRELTSAEAHFVAIATQLRARVDTLRGNSDYEYLPSMIERFARLDAVFGHQRSQLALKQEAMAASASAKLRLGVVRETLAADAAGAAEASIANIAAGASRIKLTAAAMVVMLIIAVSVPMVRSWQSSRAAGRALATSLPAGGEAPSCEAPEGIVRTTVTSLEALIKAQGNLEHWRQTLIAKLTSAVASALNRGVGHPQTALVEHRQGDPGAVAVDGLEYEPAGIAALPPELTPCLMRVVGCIEKVAAQTSLAGLKASLDGVRLIGGVTADNHQGGAPGERAEAVEAALLPSDALIAAAATADAVTEKVGNTISEINAVAMPADRDWAQAAAEIVRMIAQLGDQVSSICAADGPRAGPLRS